MVKYSDRFRIIKILKLKWGRTWEPALKIIISVPFPKAREYFWLNK